MKKAITPLTLFLMAVSTTQAQDLKKNTPVTGTLMTEAAVVQPFVTIHKEKDSPFEIYQDLIQDQMVIRLRNQFDVLRFEIRNSAGQVMPVKGRQDKNEVIADLKTLSNGRYRLIVDKNKEKIFTEFFLER